MILNHGESLIDAPSANTMTIFCQDSIWLVDLFSLFSGRLNCNIQSINDRQLIELIKRLIYLIEFDKRPFLTEVSLKVDMSNVFIFMIYILYIPSSSIMSTRVLSVVIVTG